MNAYTLPLPLPVESTAARGPALIQPRVFSATSWNRSLPSPFVGAPRERVQTPSVPLAMAYRGSESVVARGSLRLAGQRFEVEHADDCVYIRHQKWSLIGQGATLLEAEKDLRSEAADLREVLDSKTVENSSFELRRLHRFVTRLG